MVRLVLFDIDGTLIQTGGAGEKAFGRVCETEFGVPNATARLHFAGRTDTAIVREFFEQHGLDATSANFARFFDRYVYWLDHMLRQLAGRVLPGVLQMIAELAGRSRPPLMGLLTGNIRLGAQIKLTHYQLWDHFAIGGFGDDHEDRNQIAAIVRARASRMLLHDLSGDEVVVIGDTPLDISCARAIGAKVLAVATGTYPLEQLKALQPTWVAPDLSTVRAAEICE